MPFKLGCWSIRDYPVENQVYSVAAFADTLGGNPGVYLCELPDFACACKGIKASAWPLSAFPHVDERETDISAFKEHLIVAPATRERVDA